MKNLRSHFLIIILMIASVASAAASSTGETQQRTVFLDACIKCHGDTPAYPMRGAVLEFETSGHRNNGNAHYANGNNCQQCHTHEGFVEFVETGKVEGFVRNPSQPGCFTCHTPHTTGDFSLRTTKPVTLANGSVFDMGAGNLCASCHMARTDAKAVVKPMPAKAVTVRFGPHHGPQADIVMGTNAFEFPGKTYSNSAHAKIIKDGCAICHMAQPQGRYSLSAAVGGHSFSLVGEVHETEVLNVSACSSCHEGVKQVPGKDIYDIMAEKDYDLDGSLEPVQEEVIGLLERLSNGQGTGLLQTIDPPLHSADGSFVQSGSDQIRPVGEVAALYNYLLILEDRSKGIHNAVYAIQILYDTIKALDPSFDDSLRPD